MGFWGLKGFGVKVKAKFYQNFKGIEEPRESKTVALPFRVIFNGTNYQLFIF